MNAVNNLVSMAGKTVLLITFHVTIVKKQDIFSKVCWQTRIDTVETVDVSDRSNSLHISAITTTPRIDQCHLAAIINGKTVDVLIDSSSDLTIVSENTAKHLGLVFSPVAHPVLNIVSANGTQVKMIGTITDACI